VLRIATASVLASRVRLALTALAVVLGVSFVSGTFVLTDSIDRAFGQLLTDIGEGVDAYVNPAEDVDASSGAPGIDASGGALLDESVLDEVRAVDGVASAVGSVEGVAVVVGADGEVVGGQGPPQLGGSWDGGLGAAALRDGREPEGPGELLVDVTTFERAGFTLGDTVTVLVPGGPRELELVGTVGFGEEDNLLGATLALVTLDAAQELFDKPDGLDQVVVTAADGVDADDLVARIDAAVGGPDVEVVSAADQQAQDQQAVTEGLAFLDTVLLAFAGISLFVAGFLIVNTFSITVAQRTREFALLRAVGASGRQVRAVVVVEAVAVGLAGGALGLLGGVALAELLQLAFGAFGADFPDGGIVVAPRTVVASFTISVLVTTLAALAPARRASRVSPVEALRGTGAVAPDHVGVARTVVGLLLVVVGGAGLAVGLLVEGQGVALVGAGVAALFVGVALLAPFVARPVTAVLGVVLGRGVVARLARANAGRNPARTAATASALMVGVALVTFVSIVAASVTASLGTLFEEQFGADLAVQAQGGFGTLPRDLAPQLREVDGVGSVSNVRIAGGRLDDGGDVLVAGVDPAVVDDHLRIGPSQGALAALEPGTVMVSQGVADDRDLGPGDEVVLSLPAAQDARLEVVGTFAERDLLGTDWIVPLVAWPDLVGQGTDTLVSVRFAPDVDRDAVRADVEAVTEAYPGVAVQDVGEVLASTQAQVDGLLNVLIGLLALALVIAVIGIVNTLALSVLERTREIGLLRAVGMARRQVRRAVRLEAVLVALFGAGLGVLLGVGFGAALVTTLADDGITTLVVPGGRIAVYLVGAGLAGVLAAALPARRAARLDVLRAVTVE